MFTLETWKVSKILLKPWKVFQLANPETKNRNKPHMMWATLEDIHQLHMKRWHITWTAFDILPLLAPSPRSFCPSFPCPSPAFSSNPSLSRRSEPQTRDGLKIQTSTEQIEWFQGLEGLFILLHHISRRYSQSRQLSEAERGCEHGPRFVPPAAHPRFQIQIIKSVSCRLYNFDQIEQHKSRRQCYSYGTQISSIYQNYIRVKSSLRTNIDRPDSTILKE